MRHHNSSEKDNYEIKSEDLSRNTEMGPIGKGNFGFVYLAEMKSTGGEVVVKIPIRKEGLNEEYLRSLFEEELKIALKLKMSPYSNEVVTLTAFCTEEMWIVMKRYEKSLAEFLFGNRNQRLLDLDTIVNIGKKASAAVASMHELSLVHFDVAARNFMMLGKDPYLTDYGLSRELPDKENAVFLTEIVHQYPLVSTPPEFWERREYGKKTDVYAFGVLLLEMFTLKQINWTDEGQLYTDDPNKEPVYASTFTKEQAVFIEDVIHKHRRPPIPDWLPDQIQRLIRQCFKKLPGDRPSMKQVNKQLVDFHKAIQDKSTGITWPPPY